MNTEFPFQELPSEVDPAKPLVYLWEIRDRNGKLVTCYVGKASGGASRPRRAYANNIRRLRAGLPWHGQLGKTYRPIHYALSAAMDEGHRVTLKLLRNIGPAEDINEVERRERSERGCAGA